MKLTAWNQKTIALEKAIAQSENLNFGIINLLCLLTSVSIVFTLIIKTDVRI